MNGMTNACVSFQDQVTGAQGLPGAQWLREEGDGRFHFFQFVIATTTKTF